jgi:hypothetical protein
MRGLGKPVINSRTTPLSNHRVEGLAPVPGGVVHHDADENRNQGRQYGGTIADLIAIDAAIPGCPAVHQLIAQHIEPVEHDREQRNGVARCKRVIDRALGFAESLCMIAIARRAVMVAPEGGEYIGIVQEQPDFLRKAGPDTRIDHLAAIERDEGMKIAAKRLSLLALSRVDLACIGRIEGHPQQDELHIQIVSLCFGATQPAQGAMHAQGERFWKAISDVSLAGFQGLVAEPDA